LLFCVRALLRRPRRKRLRRRLRRQQHLPLRKMRIRLLLNPRRRYRLA
jgi:hypothetical protein